jgi:hypothetical protein
VALVLAGSSAALASPRADPTSGRAVFTGAASVHPTSVLINPAILGIDAVTSWYGALTLVAEQEHVATRVEDEAGALTPGPTLADARASFGGELAVVSHPTKRIALGGQFRSAPAETFFSAPGAAFHAEGGEQRDLALTVGGSLQVSDIFFIGAAIGLGFRVSSFDDVSYLPRHRLRLRFARDTVLERGSAGLAADCGGARCGFSNPEAIEHYDIEVFPPPWVSNQNLSLTLGLALKLGHDTYVGLAYHTPPGFSVQSTLVGKARVTLAPRDGGGVVEGDAVVDVSYPANVELGVRTPIINEALQLSAGGRWEDTSRLAGYDVRPYGRDLAAAGVPEWIRRARGLHDAVALWAGVEQVDAGQAWRIGGRLGYETAAIDDDKISPGNNASDSVTLDGGVQWRLPIARWVLEFNYGLAYFPSTSVTSSQYSPRNLVDCVDGGYDYASSECRAVREGYALQNANGDYRRLQHALRLGVRYEY